MITFKSSFIPLIEHDRFPPDSLAGWPLNIVQEVYYQLHICWASQVARGHQCFTTVCTQKVIDSHQGFWQRQYANGSYNKQIDISKHPHTLMSLLVQNGAIIEVLFFEGQNNGFDGCRPLRHLHMSLQGECVPLSLLKTHNGCLRRQRPDALQQRIVPKW